MDCNWAVGGLIGSVRECLCMRRVRVVLLLKAPDMVVGFSGSLGFRYTPPRQKRVLQCGTCLCLCLYLYLNQVVGPQKVWENLFSNLLENKQKRVSISIAFSRVYKPSLYSLALSYSIIVGIIIIKPKLIIL